jgi:hypothetical protein
MGESVKYNKHLVKKIHYLYHIKSFMNTILKGRFNDTERPKEVIHYIVFKNKGSFNICLTAVINRRLEYVISKILEGR